MLDFDLEPYLGASGWYVALSGGLDSMVLMHSIMTLCRAKPESFPEPHAIHVNHSLHEDSDLWEAHCIDFCGKNNIPIYVERIKFKNEGGGIESAAREHRYRAFERYLPPFSVLFVGHHKDDQVETFFLRLLRGSGSKGLTGIPYKRPLGNSLILRPLLRCSRAEIEAYASENQISGISDISNLDTDFDRNLLRQEILPALEVRWPGYRSTVCRAISILHEDNLLLNSLLPSDFDITNIFGDPGLSLGFVSRYGFHGARIIIRRFAASHGLLAPDLSSLSEFVRQLIDSDKEKTPEIRIGERVIRRFRDGIFLLPTLPAIVQAPVVSLSPGQGTEIKGIGLLQLDEEKDGTQESGSERTVKFCWRHSEVVDHSKTLRARIKRILYREGIPPWWRDRVPIAFSKDQVLGIGRPGQVRLKIDHGSHYFLEWSVH